MSSPSPAPSPAPSPSSSSIVTNIQFSDIKSVYVTSTWVNGSGDNRIVVVSERDDIIVPIDETSWEFSPKYQDVVYSINSENGNPESFVVYKGSAGKVTVYNLKPKTKYYFYFFEYDVIGDDTEFNDDIVYNPSFSVGSITTAGVEPLTQVNVIVTDSLTTLPIKDSDITFTNRKSNIITKGRSDDKGSFTSIALPIGGIHITITAPGYNTQGLNSVFIKNLIKNKSSFKTGNIMKYFVRLLKS